MPEGLSHPSQARLSTTSSQGPSLVGIVSSQRSHALLPALSCSTEVPRSIGESQPFLTRQGSQSRSLVPRAALVRSGGRGAGNSLRKSFRRELGDWHKNQTNAKTHDERKQKASDLNYLLRPAHPCSLPDPGFLSTSSRLEATQEVPQESPGGLAQVPHNCSISA